LLAHEPLTVGVQDLCTPGAAADEPAVEQVRVGACAVVRARDLAALAAVPERQRAGTGAEREAGGVGERGGARRREPEKLGGAAPVGGHAPVRVVLDRLPRHAGHAGELAADLHIGVAGLAAGGGLEVDPRRQRRRQYDARIPPGRDGHHARPPRPVGQGSNSSSEEGGGAVGVESRAGLRARSLRLYLLDVRPHRVAAQRPAAAEQ
jgi:hypothetical protein